MPVATAPTPRMGPPKQQGASCKVAAAPRGLAGYSDLCEGPGLAAPFPSWDKGLAAQFPTAPFSGGRALRPRSHTSAAGDIVCAAKIAQDSF